MLKFKNFLKRLFTRTFLLLIIVAIALSMFFFLGWYQKQFDKVRGMYFVYKGDKALHKAELQDAIDNYSRGVTLYPEHYGAWFNLGNIYVVYEDFYSAADAYEHAVKLNPKYTVARMNLGIILAEKLGDFNGAISQYNAIINGKKYVWFIPFVFSNRFSEKTNRGIAYYNMGLAYRQKAMYLPENQKALAVKCMQNAIEAYKKACRILKRDYDSRYNLALTQHLAGDFKGAGLNYCKAIELEPMTYEAHYNLAILLRRLKKYRESLDELEKATILLTEGNNDNETSYVFDVFNEVSRTMVANNDYKYLVEKIGDSPSEAEVQNVTMVHGKMVATDDLDKAMLDNFKTCRSRRYFEKFE